MEPDKIAKSIQKYGCTLDWNPYNQRPFVPYPSPAEKSSAPLLYILPANNMDPSADISPLIVFAGVISGIFLAAFIMLLIHMHLLRRKARAKSNSDLSPTQQQHQEAASRRQRRRRYDHDHDHDPDDGDDNDELEDLASEKSTTTSFSVSSLSLEPNQPIFVDVVVIEESSVGGPITGAGGAQTGLQFILTPPTPGR